jgi:zinc transport system substrate-binding protein
MPGYLVRQLSCHNSVLGTGFRLNGVLLWSFLVLGCLFGGASPAGAAPPAGKLPVAATIVPLGDFCRQIGRDLVQVQVLIPPGASPHLFEPAPSVMAKSSQARVFVSVGAGLEPWAARVLRSRSSKDLVVVEAAQGVPLLGHNRQDHHHEDAGIRGHSASPAEKVGGHGPKLAGNPHIWLDPMLAQEICRQIARAFIQADPGHRAQYEANVKDYQAKLAALDQEIKQHAQTWRLRDYVSFHPSFAYFARRYNLREAGTIEAAPGREPTPRHLQNLVAAIRRYGIKVVFAEPQLNPRVAEVIAQEAGVKVLRLDPIGGAPPCGSDYLCLMRANLAALDEALR